MYLCQSKTTILTQFLCVLVAIRCYENLGHLHLEQQAGKEDYKEEQSRRRKYRSRRERVCMNMTHLLSLKCCIVLCRNFKGDLQLFWNQKWIKNTRLILILTM